MCIVKCLADALHISLLYGSRHFWGQVSARDQGQAVQWLYNCAYRQLQGNMLHVCSIKKNVYLLYMCMCVDLASSSSCQLLLYSIELSTHGDKCGCVRLECISLYCQSAIFSLMAHVLVVTGWHFCNACTVDFRYTNFDFFKFHNASCFDLFPRD